MTYLKYGCRYIVFFVFIFMIPAIASAVPNITVVSAESAFAYNPNYPAQIVALSPDTIIPLGWQIYMSGSGSQVTLKLSNGTTVEISGPGFYDINGATVTPSADVQGVVTQTANVIGSSSTKVSAIQAEKDKTDVSADAIDDPVRDMSPST